jgi:hypothetical protein
MPNLIEIVKKDICAFLRSNEKLFFNERDLQMHLATWLRKSENNYDNVDIEYYVPCQALNNYVWETELRLDIVVKKDGKYCPVELKYKTKKVERQISRFDEFLSEKIIVMKEQGAQNLGMYDFWKDVRRIELVRNRFKSVCGGLAVFLTNDVFYTKGSKPSSNNHLFSMIGNVPHSTKKHWSNPNSTCAKTHPNFEVEKAYDIEWHSRKIDDIDFYYCIASI